MRKTNIVKSKTSPSRSDLWLTYDDNKQPVIKKWTSSGWEAIMGSTGQEIAQIKDAIASITDMAPEDLDTLKEIADKISSVEGGIPTKTSDLTNDSGFITADDVHDPDLSPYALKEEIPTKTSDLTNDSGYITLDEVPETDLSEYAKTESIPTKISDLANDSGFITVDQVPDPDLTIYAKKTDLATKVSQLINDVPYLTESDLADINSKLVEIGDQLYIEQEIEDASCVDLGLPSGLRWAKCNIGADTEEGYGLFFQWGATEGYTDASHSTWATAPFNNGSSDYNESYFASVSGTVCPNGVLAPQYDAANVNMGGNWRMPTAAECKELLDNTTNEYTTVNGVKGRRFTGSNGNSIFIPVSGFAQDGLVYSQNELGRVWTSSLNDGTIAYALGIYSQTCKVDNYYSRKVGYSVRPVNQSITDETIRIPLIEYIQTLLDNKADKEIINEIIESIQSKYTKSSTGIPKSDLSSDVQSSLSKADTAIQSSTKGQANGVAGLDANGKISSSQLPSYVDDVLEYGSYMSLPTTGESGKIYVTTDNNKTYRWSGTTYVEVGKSVVIGTTEGTAFDGARGAQLESTLVNLENIIQQQSCANNVLDVIQVLDDGFYIIDQDYNIGFAVNSDGAHAYNLLEYELTN